MFGVDQRNEQEGRQGNREKPEPPSEPTPSVSERIMPRRTGKPSRERLIHDTGRVDRASVESDDQSHRSEASGMPEAFSTIDANNHWPT